MRLKGMYALETPRTEPLNVVHAEPTSPTLRPTADISSIVDGWLPAGERIMCTHSVHHVIDSAKETLQDTLYL